MAQDCLKAVVIDDHESMRRMTRRLLLAAGFEVIGEAATGREGIELVRQAEPDLVLLDVVLPDISGTEVANELQQQGTSSGVLLMSTYDREDLHEAALQAGTLGFIPKTELTVESIKSLGLSLN